MPRGNPSCFAEALWGHGQEPGCLARLEKSSRRGTWRGPRDPTPPRSWIRGLPRVAQKVGEEAVETVVAALVQSRERVIEESADLLYHPGALVRDECPSLGRSG